LSKNNLFLARFLKGLKTFIGKRAIMALGIDTMINNKEVKISFKS